MIGKDHDRKKHRVRCLTRLPSGIVRSGFFWKWKPRPKRATCPMLPWVAPPTPATKSGSANALAQSRKQRRNLLLRIYQWTRSNRGKVWERARANVVLDGWGEQSEWKEKAGQGTESVERMVETIESETRMKDRGKPREGGARRCSNETNGEKVEKWEWDKEWKRGWERERMVACIEMEMGE